MVKINTEPLTLMTHWQLRDIKPHIQQTCIENSEVALHLWRCVPALYLLCTTGCFVPVWMFNPSARRIHSRKLNQLALLGTLTCLLFADICGYEYQDHGNV